MKRTGDILRKAREAKNLSINELALSLKINSKALTAIEEGDLSKLPAKTFLRGFVQSYAQALKIETDEVLSVFADEMGSTRPQPVVMTNSPSPSSSVSTSDLHASTGGASDDSRPTMVDASKITPILSRNESKSESLKGLEETSHLKIALLSGVSLVLILMIFGTKKVIDRYQREATKADVVVTTPLNHNNFPSQGASALDPNTTTPENVLHADEKKQDSTKSVQSEGTGATESPSAKNDESASEKPKETEKNPTAADIKPKPAVETPKHAPTYVNRNAPVDLPPQEETPLLNSLNPTRAQPLSPMNAKAALSTKTIINNPTKNGAAVEPKPEAKAQILADPKSEPVKPIEATKAESAISGTSPEEIKKKKSVELIIEAMDPVDIEYSTSSGPAQKIHLNADQVHTIRSKNGIKLTVSNAGVVNLILNGRDLGVPGGLGSPATLRY